MNKVIKIFWSELIVTAIVFGGCVSSISSVEKGQNIYSLAESRFSVEIIRYKASLGEKITTTPVHPDDSSFLSGETSVEPNKKNTWAPSLGLFGSIGTKELRLVCGISSRSNPLHYNDGTREGFYDNRQQVSDLRPPSEGSFVFTQLKPDAFTFIPSVGLECSIDHLTIRGSFGLPYMKWTARSGHDRYSSWETIQRDSWRGFGKRYALTLDFNSNEDNNQKYFISYFNEKYEPKFAGEDATLSGNGLMIGILHRW